MAEYRHSLVKILADHVDAPYDPEHPEYIECVAAALCERHEQFLEWPPSVRMFYVCYEIMYQVGNGGFAQAAYNVPELLPIAQTAFERFGCWQAAELCGRAVSMLPAELQEHFAKGLRADRRTIADVFEHLSESQMTDLDKDVPGEFWVDDKLQELVEQNRKDFQSVDSIS